MNKYPLLGFTICAVVLLVLGSLSNVVGYQSVQTSQQNVIKERFNQRELLFQIIVDIVNNKEIQRTILKSQISRGIFPNPDVKISITKNQLKEMYFIGVLFSKEISTSRMQSILGKYQFKIQKMQREMNTIIGKDTKLNTEMRQLSTSECDCENEDTAGIWKFPIVCTTLYILMIVVIYALLTLTMIFNGPIMHIFIEYLFLMVAVISAIYRYLECPWTFDFYPW